MSQSQSSSYTCVMLTSRAELKEYVKNNKVVIVKFKAEWCGPCKNIEPMTKQLMEVHNDIKYAIVDVDDGSGIASYLRIRTIPTMVSYLDGDINEFLTSSNQQDIVDFFNKTSKLA